MYKLTLLHAIWLPSCELYSVPCDLAIFIRKFFVAPCDLAAFMRRFTVCHAIWLHWCVSLCCSMGSGCIYEWNQLFLSIWLHLSYTYIVPCALAAFTCKLTLFQVIWLQSWTILLCSMRCCCVYVCRFALLHAILRHLWQIYTVPCHLVAFMHTCSKMCSGKVWQTNWNGFFFFLFFFSLHLFILFKYIFYHASSPSTLAFTK